MTFQFEQKLGSEEMMSAMHTADTDELFVIARCGALANHVISKLGIAKEEAEKCWEFDTDTSSLLLCLVSPDNDRMVTIGVQAIPSSDFPDVVLVQVVNPRVVDGTLGVQYRVRLERGSNEIIEESIQSVTNHNVKGRGARVRTIIRSEIPEAATWGKMSVNRKFRGDQGLNDAMRDVRYCPARLKANKPLSTATFTDTTPEELVLMQASDVFAALADIAGDVSEYTSVPASELT